MARGIEKLTGLNSDWASFVRYCLARADQAGLQPRVTSGKRTRAEQSNLYADYLHGRRTLPVAPPGTSAHEYGLAVDVVSDNGKQRELVALFKKYGAETVANDPPHFQYPGFHDWLHSG